MDIPRHVPFAEGAKDLKFGGTRNVGGQALVLLRAGDVVMVMAIDELSARRAARLKLDDPIRIKDGAVQGRGRRR